MDDRRGEARPGSSQDRRPRSDGRTVSASIDRLADLASGATPELAGEHAPDADAAEDGPRAALSPAPPPIDGAEVPSSAWIATAPPRRGRSFGSTIVTIGAVLVGLAVIAAIVGLNLRLFMPRGQVLFGTAFGSDLCSVGSETRTIANTDPVFFAAVLKNRLRGDQSVRLTVTRDGEAFFENVDPANGTEFECYGSRESIGPLEPGVYVFEVTHDGVVEAAGTLTVT